MKQNEQPTLVIRVRTKVENLPCLIAESYGKLCAYMEELGEIVSDLPFVAYHNMDMQDLDVEIGFPVANPLPGKGDIKPGTIPEGTRIFCMYRGPYEEMAPIYEEMQKWMYENGYASAGPVYENYYNGTDFPAHELLTRIVMMVRKA
ncbi:GyrI-like domain-containing protein [Peptoclostridium acidaminophilum]|uniref:GyrI-like domain-containing protein n=1 Tax=Peptoclostridium acidaminophilum TaxID=1731 RepID=UPI002ADDD551|nr:GyrI-like domain-containing protein [Peptoclostridium acidaminophilum]